MEPLLTTLMPILFEDLFVQKKTLLRHFPQKNAFRGFVCLTSPEIQSLKKEMGALLASSSMNCSHIGMQQKGAEVGRVRSNLELLEVIGAFCDPWLRGSRKTSSGLATESRR